MKGFAQGLVLKQRHKVTEKWPNSSPLKFKNIYLTGRSTAANLATK